MPCGLASAASRAIPSRPTVLACTHTVPWSSAGIASAITSATASSSNSIVTTICAPRTASAIDATTVAPSSPSGAAFSGCRFQTVSGRPARRIERAIPSPIVPVPSRAIEGVNDIGGPSVAGAVTLTPLR